MKNIQPLQTFSKIKILADARRMEIFRMLMAAPSTLTQIGQRLGETPAWVRHHIKTLESAELIELGEIRTNGIVVEKFYRAKAGALLLQELILPQSEKPVIVFSGSHDLALDQLANQLESHLHLLAMPVGSLDGLVNLRQGLCHISGSHLLDSTGEYNTPFVRHLFPDRAVEMVTLAYRTQGLMLAPGNPKGIRELADLAREDVTFLNRNPGSGTRLWLDRELARQGIPTSNIRGYERVASTHSETARAIREGQADASLGIQAAAYAQGLDFIPLFDERYDLVLPAEEQEHLAPLLDQLQTASFRRSIENLTGYVTAHSGEQIHL